MGACERSYGRERERARVSLGVYVRAFVRTYVGAWKYVSVRALVKQTD